MKEQEKYAELFASEAREHLSEISHALVTLEADPTDAASLEAIFRSVHTIKGMAAAMGHDAATRLAHSMESALEQLRAGRQQVESSVIDLLLQGTDRLGELVEAAVAGADSPDPATMVERLESLTAAVAEREAAPARAKAKAAAEGTAGRPSRRADGSRVRVDIRRLDALMNLIGELVIVRGRLRALAEQLGSEALQDAVERTSRLIAEMQTEVVESRMVPVWQVFDRLPRVVRDSARSEGKEVELEIAGKDLELDRSLLDAIGDPLIHLLRNAVGHGIEPPDEREKAGKPRAGRIELSARRERSRVVIVVQDDGRGVDRKAVIARARKRGLLDRGVEPTDQEIFRIMARPGFSTVGEVTTLSGRGIGLNVVDDCVRGLGGSIELKTERGIGTTFRLELPLTLAIVRALIVDVAGQVYAVPVTFTRETFEQLESAVEQDGGREWVNWRDERLPLTRLQSLFDGRGAEDRGGTEQDELMNLVALEFGGQRLAVSVDRFVGEEEIVVKSVDLPRGALPVFSGATVRPDGRPALLLDVGSLS